MESDSDLFESADEEFDEEPKNPNTNTKPHQTSNDNNKQLIEDASKTVSDIKNVYINEPESVLKTDDCSECDNKTRNVVENTNLYNDETANANVTSKKQQRMKNERVQRSKTKIGTKLGAKIDSNQKTTINWEQFDQPETTDEPTNWPSVQNEIPESDRKLYSEKSDYNMWDDETHYMELPRKEVQKVVEPESEKNQRSGWSGWSSWGVSSILTTASNLTTTVSQGITTVLESGIGVPDPEELARIHKEQKENQLKSELSSDDDENKTKTQLSFGLGNLVSGVTQITKLVETTGTKVLTGGLDTLEVIGKKTMQVLQEGDPGLKKKRALFRIENEPILSHILREAKDKAEEENRLLEQQHVAKKAHYETIFDDYQGLVHLEALEMLSKQCEIKLETLIETYSGAALTEMQETMGQIKELCELPEDEEENDPLSSIEDRIENAIKELNVKITYERFIETWSGINVWIDQDLETCTGDELHDKAIESLAHLTSIAVEQFHKTGELLLIKERRSTVDEADSLVQLTMILTGIIGNVAGKFTGKLNTSETDLITNIFLEAANSSSYIRNAFNLLIPVLQVGAV